ARFDLLRHYAYRVCGAPRVASFRCCQVRSRNARPIGHKPLLLTTYQGRNHMNAKILGSLAVMALLTACSSNQPAANAAPSAPTSVGIVPGSQEDLVANVGDRIYFDFNQSNIRGSGPRTANNMATLDKQAAWLQKYPQNKVQVAGNCDERGTEEYN